MHRLLWLSGAVGACLAARVWSVVANITGLNGVWLGKIMFVRKTDMTTDDRLLRVLEALNNVGTCTVLDLARTTGIPRPSVYRAVDRLCRGGYAQRVPGDSRVRLTSRVRAL